MTDDEHVLEFRDGKRVVPDYLYPEMSQLETHRMTYEQAIKEADAARMNKWLGDQQHDLLVSHFRQGRGF
jgi:hypothetical protein